MNEENHGHQLTGPFTAQPSGLGGYEIADADGTIAIWAYGRGVAEMVVAQLNSEDDPLK